MQANGVMSKELKRKLLKELPLNLIYDTKYLDTFSKVGYSKMLSYDIDITSTITFNDEKLFKECVYWFDLNRKDIGRFNGVYITSIKYENVLEGMTSEMIINFGIQSIRSASWKDWFIVED